MNCSETSIITVLHKIHERIGLLVFKRIQQYYKIQKMDKLNLKKYASFIGKIMLIMLQNYVIT